MSSPPEKTPPEPGPRGSEPQLVWLRPERSHRPKRTPPTRQALARAAISLADTEGFEAVTMRRVAVELGLATMSLYSHVASKEELIEIAADELIGEMVVTDDFPDHWRDALTLIARRARVFFLRHPWLLSYAGESWPVGGPNLMRHVDQTLAAVSSLKLDQPGRWQVARVIDNYAVGAAMDQIQDEREKAADAADGGRRAADRAELFARMIATGDYPHLAAESSHGGRLEPWENTDADAQFELGLTWLLDGIAATEARSDAREFGAGAGPVEGC
jgi:AcrR family transcriptional regulator